MGIAPSWLCSRRVLASILLAGCAASGSQDVAGGLVDDASPGGRADSDGGAGARDAGGGAGSDGGAGGPGVFDSGPPAVIGGQDAGGDGGAPGGSCTTLAGCPYENAPNVAGVSCLADGGCAIACKGESYDVNGALADGCEVDASCPVANQATLCPVDDHAQASAAFVGSFSCTDSASAQALSGTIPSDARQHLPPVDGFVALTGAAPAFFRITGTGGLCDDDANFALAMVAPTKQMACYMLTLITDKQTQTCNTSSQGQCSISNGSGSYTDNSDIYVEVSKLDYVDGDGGVVACAAGETMDDGAFQVTGHL